MQQTDEYPRELAAQDRDLLLWVLPADRPGYCPYRDAVTSLPVVARGRRGAGNYILAPADAVIDRESPLPAVVAYGMIEGLDAKFAVAVREFLGPQLEFEIMNLSGAGILEDMQETRRWTFSDWLPGKVCPACLDRVRGVSVGSHHARQVVLAVCPRDQRLWVYDGESGINYPIPITNFYNELMLRRRIRDPKVALRPDRLFDDIDRYSDRDLASAFQTYNLIRMKVELDPIEYPSQIPAHSVFERIRSLFTRKMS